MIFDIEKEIEIYNCVGIEQFSSMIDNEKIMLDKKKHFFQVFNALKEFQIMVDKNEFSDHGVYFLHVSPHFISCLISTQILNQNKEKIHSYDSEYNPILIYQKITDIFVHVFLNNFSNEEFKDKEERIFATDSQLINNLKSVLLNTELRAIFDHMTLDEKISEKVQSFIKLNKI